MSYLFGGATSDTASKASPGLLTSIPAKVWGFAYVKHSAINSNKTIWSLQSATGGQWVFRLPNGTGNLEVDGSGAGTDERAITSDTPLTTGTWQWVGFTSEFSVGTTVYVGTEYVAPVARSLAGGTDQRGTSQVTFIGAVTLSLGNSSAVTRAVQGNIGGAAAFGSGVIPTLAQMQQMWRFPAQALKGMGCDCLVFPGLEKGSTMKDYSGSGNDLTISGATVAPTSEPLYRPTSGGILVAS